MKIPTPIASCARCGREIYVSDDGQRFRGGYVETEKISVVDSETGRVRTGEVKKVMPHICYGHDVKRRIALIDSISRYGEEIAKSNEISFAQGVFPIQGMKTIVSRNYDCPKCGALGEKTCTNMTKSKNFGRPNRGIHPERIANALEENGLYAMTRMNGIWLGYVSIRKIPTSKQGSEQ